MIIEHIWQKWSPEVTVTVICSGVTDWLWIRVSQNAAAARGINACLSIWPQTSWWTEAQLCHRCIQFTYWWTNLGTSSLARMSCLPMLTYAFQGYSARPSIQSGLNPKSITQVLYKTKREGSISTKTFIVFLGLSVADARHLDHHHTILVFFLFSLH